MSPRVTGKRARTDADEDPQDTKPDPSANPGIELGHEANVLDLGPAGGELKKDENFWFDDGTIILHAGDVEFRVYRGLLESHSTVLAELFAQPHSRRDVSVDGQHSVPCSVIKLSDSAHDLRHVLRCCMPRHSGSLFTTVAPSFDVVSAAIRLGHKYQIDDMYREGITFLKGHFTDDVDTWNAHSLWMPKGWYDAHAIGVINLARLTGELSLLPVAFMVCVIRLEADIVHGFIREDGSQEHLTLDDVGLCYAARARLREASVAAVFRVLSTSTSAPTCKALPPGQCSKTLKNTFRGKKLESNINILITGDLVLHTANNYFQTEGGGCTLCQPCLDVLCAKDLKENRILWGRLPELLGIEVPGWGKLAEAPPVPAPAPAHAPAAAT